MSQEQKNRVYRYAKVSDFSMPVPEPPKMREHWWQLWRPKYLWMQQPDVTLSDNIAVGESTGRVTKVTSPSEYGPNKKVKGGRVTKTMPRQLREIKEGQEHVE